jgi:hypothetical protein
MKLPDVLIISQPSRPSWAMAFSRLVTWFASVTKHDILAVHHALGDVLA